MPALITLHRPWNFVACARTLKVQIDGTQLAPIMVKMTRIYEVAPGDHVVRVTMDWCASPPLALTVSEGETINLLAGIPNMFSLQGLWDSMFGSLFWPKRYLILFRADAWAQPDQPLPQPSNYPRSR